MIDTPAMPATCSSVARPVPLPLLRPVLSIVILSWRSSFLVPFYQQRTGLSWLPWPAQKPTEKLDIEFTDFIVVFLLNHAFPPQTTSSTMAILFLICCLIERIACA